MSSQNSEVQYHDETCFSKEARVDLIRSVLPACQPQEGSPPNTFTQSELDDLQRAMPNMQFGPRDKVNEKIYPDQNKLDICDLAWHDPNEASVATRDAIHLNPMDPDSAASPQDDTFMESETILPTAKYEEESLPQEGNWQPELTEAKLDWHGAPRFNKEVSLPRAFRNEVRAGRFVTATNGVCPGFMQCNLVVLPEGREAFDFLLFCQRNPKACPLIEVCDVGSPYPTGIAPGADLRTDIPKYAIYRDGKLEKEVTDVTEYWPENSVAFLIGCSFSYDGALMDAGIPLKSAEQGKNVPMYNTNLKCRPAGSLHGNMVVSMKPIPALQVSKHVEITSKYSHAHGGPVCIGSPSAIGIKDIDCPEWGDPVDVAMDEVAVFHACGVTPQSILMESKVPFAITHSAGHMFVTDLPSDMGV